MYVCHPLYLVTEPFFFLLSLRTLYFTFKNFYFHLAHEQVFFFRNRHSERQQKIKQIFSRNNQKPKKNRLNERFVSRIFLLLLFKFWYISLAQAHSTRFDNDDVVSVLDWSETCRLGFPVQRKFFLFVLLVPSSIGKHNRLFLFFKSLVLCYFKYLLDLSSIDLIFFYLTSPSFENLWKN